MPCWSPPRTRLKVEEKGAADRWGLGVSDWKGEGRARLLLGSAHGERREEGKAGPERKMGWGASVGPRGGKGRGGLGPSARTEGGRFFSFSFCFSFFYFKAISKTNLKIF